MIMIEFYAVSAIFSHVTAANDNEFDYVFYHIYISYEMLDQKALEDFNDIYP